MAARWARGTCQWSGVADDDAVDVLAGQHLAPVGHRLAHFPAVVSVRLGREIVTPGRETVAGGHDRGRRPGS
ncbi:MAG: hypothetical protein MZV64_64550 [Ignavibacteriales bacterium]|nr:hypothetical protein [Ignavibacteriales bacterium]